jgi:acetyl-CoA carboxylase carboxyl transferase subunit alpha
MTLHYLEFEKPLQQLASKVEELEKAHKDNPKLNNCKIKQTICCMRFMIN